MVARHHGPVVQLNRTSDSGSESRGFESRRGHNYEKINPSLYAAARFGSCFSCRAAARSATYCRPGHRRHPRQRDAVPLRDSGCHPAAYAGATGAGGHDGLLPRTTARVLQAGLQRPPLADGAGGHGDNDAHSASGRRAGTMEPDLGARRPGRHAARHAGQDGRSYKRDVLHHRCRRTDSQHTGDSLGARGVRGALLPRRHTEPAGALVHRQLRRCQTLPLQSIRHTCRRMGNSSGIQPDTRRDIFLRATCADGRRARIPLCLQRLAAGQYGGPLPEQRHAGGAILALLQRPVDGGPRKRHDDRVAGDGMLHAGGADAFLRKLHHGAQPGNRQEGGIKS